MRLFHLLIAIILCLMPHAGQARTAVQIVTTNAALIEKPSRQTIAPIIAELVASGRRGAAGADDISTADNDGKPDNGLRGSAESRSQNPIQNLRLRPGTARHAPDDEKLINITNSTLQQFHA